MAIRKIRDLLIPFVTICLILGTSFALIAYGRGYRIDIGKNKLKPTGLISATSDPIGAQVYIDGQLKTATNNSINVDPGIHNVKIIKEGYIGWEKKINVQGEVVFRADAFLFPTNPNLSSLTTVGIEHAWLSPDGTKVAYTVPKNSESLGKSKAGLWVLELAERPLGRNRDPQQIGSGDALFDFTNANVLWSPDSTRLLVDNNDSIRLYQTKNTPAFADVTEVYRSTLKEWAEDQKAKDSQKLAAFPQEIINMASSSAKIISFSPDETKILYQATAAASIPVIINPPFVGANSAQETRNIRPGNIYVYDVREDKNFFLLEPKELPPTGTPKKISRLGANTSPIQWLPTNRHLLLTLNGKIDVMEYDRTNWITVYAGPFNQGFLAPWPNGSRLVIITSLNPGATTMPNLYTVNFR